MKILISFLFILRYKIPSVCAVEQIHQRIVGGNIAKPNSLPYQVGISIDSFDGQICAMSATIFLGANENLNKTEEGQIRLTIHRNLSNYIIHPQWNMKAFVNDIALIKMDEHIKYSSRIQPIALPSYKLLNESFNGFQSVASGWGSISDSAQISSVLRYTNLTVIPNSLCESYFKYQAIKEKHLCTSGNDGKSTCEGDSGGPLVAENGSGLKILIGITSFGTKDGCQMGFSNVFTRVTYYLNWIAQEAGIEIRL